MKDVNCPYCNHEQYINHDDGYGYSEDEKHTQECEGCKKTFVYTTYISYNHEASKADCLNGAEHTYKPTTTHPRLYTKMECEHCGEQRSLTEEEWKELNVSEIVIHNS